MRAGGLAPLVTTLEGSQTVMAGQAATFSVSAEGSGSVSYQWYFSGSAISGATGATYTIPSASSGNAGTYTLVATDPYGSGTSSTYTLTVNTSIPALPVWAAAGLSALLLLAAAPYLRAKQRKTTPRP